MAASVIKNVSGGVARVWMEEQQLVLRIKLRAFNCDCLGHDGYVLLKSVRERVCVCVWGGGGRRQKNRQG